MPRRVLVRLPNWLGDVMMARPLLHALAALEGVEVRSVTVPGLVALLSAEPAAGEVGPWPSGGRERAAVVRRMRSWLPDVALVLPPSFSSAWFAWRSGAPLRIGYRHEGRAILLTHAPARPARGERHLSAEYLALGMPLGLTPRETPVLPLPPGSDAAAAGLLDEIGIGVASFAVLGPGARYGPAKRWPAERFVALGKDLVGRGLRVVVSGAADERPLAERVASEIGPAAACAAGRGDLPLLAGLCARAAVTVSNDSGLAHLAAAVGSPVVAVFGSTSSAWTSPHGPRVRVVQHAPPCGPCFQRTCRIGYGCLHAVTVREVASACEHLAA